MKPKIEISASPLSGGAMPGSQTRSAKSKPHPTPECLVDTTREIQVSETNGGIPTLLTVLLPISLVGNLLCEVRHRVFAK